MALSPNSLVWLVLLCVVFALICALTIVQLVRSSRLSETAILGGRKSLGWTYHRWLLWSLLISATLRLLSSVLLIFFHLNQGISFVVQRVVSMAALIAFIASKNLVIVFFGEFWVSLTIGKASKRVSMITSMRWKMVALTAFLVVSLAVVVVWSTMQLNQKSPNYAVAIVAAVGMSLVIALYIVQGVRLVSALFKIRVAAHVRWRMIVRVGVVIAVVVLSFLARSVVVLLSHFIDRVGTVFEKNTGLTHFWFLSVVEGVPSLFMLSLMGKAVIRTSIDDSVEGPLMTSSSAGRIKERLVWVDAFSFVRPPELDDSAGVSNLSNLSSLSLPAHLAPIYSQSSIDHTHPPPVLGGGGGRRRKEGEEEEEKKKVERKKEEEVEKEIP